MTEKEKLEEAMIAIRNALDEIYYLGWQSSTLSTAYERIMGIKYVNPERRN